MEHAGDLAVSSDRHEIHVAEEETTVVMPAVTSPSETVAGRTARRQLSTQIPAPDDAATLTLGPTGRDQICSLTRERSAPGNGGVEELEIYEMLDEELNKGPVERVDNDLEAGMETF